MEMLNKEGLGCGSRARDEMALYNRFKRHISKDVMLYCGYLARIQAKNKSGVSEADVELEALQLFVSTKGKSFRFLECVPILKQMPKYCLENGHTIDVDNESLDDISLLDVNHGVFSASKLERPIGNKRAKKEWMDSRTVGDKEQQLVVLETLANATNDIAKTLALKEKKEHFRAMAKFSKDIKDRKSMLGYLRKIKI